MSPGFKPTLIFVVAVLAAPATSTWSAQMSPAEIAKKAIPAVVFIKGVATDGRGGSGSGFLVDSSGTIVANLHVVRGMKSIAVKLANGDIYDQVSVKAFDERKDLAIQVRGFQLPVLELGNSDELQQGEAVTLVGNPIDLEGSVSTGIVSAIRS